MTFNPFSFANPLAQELVFIIETARSAGAQIMEFYEQPSKITVKPDQTIVTEADYASNDSIQKRCSDYYSDYGFVCEETIPDFVSNSPSGLQQHILRELRSYERVFVVDPLDGTEAWKRRLPGFSVLIALVEDFEPKIGCVYFPMIGEIVYASKGSGCWHQRGDEQPTRILLEAQSEKPLSQAEIVCSFPREGQAKQRLLQLDTALENARYYNDALTHCRLAQNFHDVVVDPKMQVWDVAALLPILWESGGFASNLEGNSDCVSLLTGGSLVSATSERMLANFIDFYNC
jgi:histidinol-phosphatase